VSGKVVMSAQAPPPSLILGRWSNTPTLTSSVVSKKSPALTGHPVDRRVLPQQKTRGVTLGGRNLAAWCVLWVRREAAYQSAASASG